MSAFTPSRRFVLVAFVLALLAGGCESRHPAAPPSPPAASSQSLRDPDAPPAPPLFEDFEGKPQLSLFPRMGDFRPEEDDEVALPFWRTYLQHVNRTSGPVVLPAPMGRGRAFSFRGVAGIPSLGYFSPLAVEPETTYRVSAMIEAELPEGGQAGIGILEFDEFLWVAEQYPQSLDTTHRTGAQEGIRLSGAPGWHHHTFTFTTGPRTRMVHLVFFREGEIDRSPVMIDEIRVEKAVP